MTTASTRLCLLPPNVALSLSPSRIRLLRQSYDGLRGFDETNPLAVAKAISFRELPERTADLFHAAAYLATDDGREAIYEASRGRRDLAPWLLLTAVDLAIDVARAADAGDVAARALQSRARKRIGRFLPVEHELFTKRRERPARLESIVECARSIFLERFVDGWVVECTDGALRAVIVHEALPAAMVARSKPEASGSAPSVARRARRPLGCDTIRWDAARGRVGLTLARASRLPEWREKLGIACAGDAGFLERRPSHTLKLLSAK
ncbi:MAG: hypothetical protein ACLQVI_03250 [Polyangiaceae bacterium]